MARILLAEDEAVLRMLIVDSLEDEGYEIDIACDGEEAFDRIKQHDYDLIVLDYMMPKLTGIEVIEQTRMLQGKQAVPIMMLSAKSQLSEQQKVLAAGADAFLSKPFSPLALIDKVKEMLNG